ncbi:zygote arrest protein 1 [Biomphalaria pfeifferi]|uniref:Zygote arrest protein 1 n=1 Tax=Biomphalaria pfeifferi TaxID=112525 RepID=A0AAD8FLS3_BIOPF|nr:zygote arrest protein 1 [Biomphalaria pfeifferi]
MYGFFRCSGCNKNWESSHVYCLRGTMEATYGQECKSCRVMCKPYRVEHLVCSQCGEVTCVCPFKERHVDPNISHRRDLCEKCRSGHPCA